MGSSSNRVASRATSKRALRTSSTQLLPRSSSSTLLWSCSSGAGSTHSSSCSILPLAVIGAIIALVVTGSALSVSALIGLLMLVGIVVTNAIVMLEFVIMLRHERGYTTYDAIVEGAQTRLRPILMTAIAAMLALIPLSLGLTEGALIAADLGRVVIGGLFSCDRPYPGRRPGDL